MADKLNVPLIDLKLASAGLGEREFEGHGSVFRNVDLGGDVVMPGAFKRTLSEHTAKGTLPVMLWMHDPTKIPGKWLEMREDNDGLYVRGELAKTPLGDEARELLRMKALAGLSIGYRTVDSDHDRNGNRLLTDVDLWEVSIVSMPMNPRAQVSTAKDSSFRTCVKSIREWETLLRMGFDMSSRAATRAASKTWRHIAEELGETAELDAIRLDIAEASAASALRSAADRIRRL